MSTRPTPARSTRVRLLATALTAAAALALTACRDGQGLRDEGPSGTTRTTGTAGTAGAAGTTGASAPPRSPSR